MKKVKKAFLIIIVFIVSGCSADYNLLVTSNHKIKENLKLFMKNDQLPENVVNIKEYFKNQITSYSDVEEYQKYNFDYKIGKEVSYVQMDKWHTSFEEYQNSTIYGELFDDILIIENSEYITFETAGRYLYSNLFAEPEMADPDFIIDGINVKIRLHNKIIESNADNFDEKNNTLEWSITSKDETKSIYFKMSHEKRYDIILIDFILLNKKVLIPISLALVIIIGSGLYFYVVYKKNNSI